MALLIIAVSGCENPLGGKNSEVDGGYDAGLPPGGGGGTTPISVHIPFDAGSEVSYFISDSSKVEFVGGVARLKAAGQQDADNSPTQFGAATMSSTTWDAGNFVRLSATTNISELDPSWAPQWSHIVGYWKLNGTVGPITNGSVMPATVGTNGLAVRAGTLSYEAGKMSQVMAFQDGKDVMKVHAALPITNKYTFSFWIYINSFPATISAPISVGSGTGAGSSPSASLAWEIFFNQNYTSGGYPAYGINMVDVPSLKKSGTGVNTFTVNDLGRWHHIVFAFDSSASRKTKIYKDGRLLPAGLDQMDASFPAHDAFWVGGYRADTNGCCNTNGKTDEVAVWNTTLTDQEVEAIYNRQSAKYSGQIKSRVMDAFIAAQPWTSFGLTTTLPFYKELTGASGSETSTNYSQLQGDTPAIGDNNLMQNISGLWHFNESSGTSGAGSVQDQSGLVHNGTPTNTSFAMPGILSSSIYLGGSGFIGIPNTADLNNTASVTTVSAWVNTTVRNNGKVFSSWDGANGYQLYVNTAGKVTTWSDTGGALVGTAVVDDGSWHHLVAVWDGMNINLYVDGKLDASGARSFHAQTKDNQIGAQCSGAGSTSCGTYFDGRIDEVAIWKKALNTTEVLQLYRRGTNRLKYQVRTCASADCSDQDALVASGQGWKGPDNTQVSYFSELHNNTGINSSANPTGSVQTGSLNLLFSTFTSAGTGLSVSNNRYFQYRAILESDDQNNLCTYGGSPAPCSPELQSATVGPDHYDPAEQSVTSKTTLGVAYTTLDAGGFSETGGACSAGLRYALSGDGLTYYYWDGSAWATSSDYSTASSAAATSANLANFSTVAGSGTLQIKTYLKSNGTSTCQIDDLVVTGQN